MYEEYTRQSLPSKKYRELLGTAISVFNSNNSFVIENYLRLSSPNNEEAWYSLVDKTSGGLNKTIKKHLDESIVEKFEELICMRNRIFHSFQITDKDNEQRLATKDKKHNQFVITEDYLYEFIKKNEEFSSKLHELRRS